MVFEYSQRPWIYIMTVQHNIEAGIDVEPHFNLCTVQVNASIYFYFLFFIYVIGLS